MEGFPGIEKTAGVCGGEPRIKGTRIAVSLLELFKRLGSDDKELLRMYPTLSQLDLDAAARYAAEHPEEIESLIREYEDADVE